MRARLAIVVFVTVGLTACASVPTAKPYVGQFTGQYVDGLPLYRFPTIEVVGIRRSIDRDM